MSPDTKTQENAEFDAAYQRMQQLVDSLADRYPAAGLSLGYIGNIQFGKDDRSWRVFTTLPSPNDPKAFYRNSPFWPRYGWDSTAREYTRAVEAAAKELEPWVRKQLGLPPFVRPATPRKQLSLGERLAAYGASPNGAEIAEKLDWAIVAKALRDAQVRLQSGGERHTWLDAPRDIADARALIPPELREEMNALERRAEVGAFATTIERVVAPQLLGLAQGAHPPQRSAAGERIATVRCEDGTIMGLNRMYGTDALFLSEAVQVGPNSWKTIRETFANEQDLARRVAQEQRDLAFVADLIGPLEPGSVVLQIASGDRSFNVVLDDCEAERKRSDGMHMLAFYDTKYANVGSFGPVGQFTGGRYLARTLAGHNGGLSLYGGEPAWTVSMEGMAPVSLLASMLVTEADISEEIRDNQAVVAIQKQLRR